MAAAQRPQQLQGRLEERELLKSFLDRAHDGSSSALLLVGEPGIGKTRMLQYAADTTDGSQVLRASGSEPETHLAYAGLHRFLSPLLDGIDVLPAPQRSALATAFGLVTGPPPDLFLVGLAALTLLADAAQRQSMLCLIDDAQWLDRESLTVIAFLGRRLDADPIVLLIGLRDDPTTLARLQGLPTHTLSGLTADDARRLIASRAEGRLDEQVASRILTETGGNPLALIEVTAALSPEQLAGGSILPELLPIGARLEAHFAQQILQLPADTRLLLLLLATAPGGDQTVLWRAAIGLGLSPAALDVAVSADILLPGHRPEIRHPLIRSAIYNVAPPADRRAVHAALGEATDRNSDPGARAWHLAESVVGLDDAVADEIETAADRARARGGYATQAAYLSRAAELTSDVPHRAQRFLAASRPYLLSGNMAAAARRLDQAGSGLTHPALQAAAQRVRAAVEWYTGGVVGRVPRILLDALATYGPLDSVTTRSILRDAMTSGLMAGWYGQATLLEIADAVQKTPRPDPATPTDLLLDGFAAQIAGGFVQAVPLLRAAVSATSTDESMDTAESMGAAASKAALDLWDDEGYGAVVTRMDTLYRTQGALQSLNSILYAAANWKTFTGRFAEAEAHHGEAAEIAAATGLPPMGSEYRVALLAWQGRETEARAAADHVRRVWAEHLGYAVMESHSLYAMLILELSLGRYPEALACGRRVFDGDLPGECNRMLADVIEAAVRADDHDFAQLAAARMTERASASGTPWALGLLARCEALLTDDEARYQDSLDLLGRTTVRTDVARTHLLYGEWLRRRGRRTDARDQLRVAHEMFTVMGAAAFAERAGTELRATGESPRKQPPQSDMGLTPREFQVATLAITGATNAEIATRLFITSSTVEYHLNKIFRKLRITSRRQLAEILSAAPQSVGSD